MSEVAPSLSGVLGRLAAPWAALWRAPPLRRLLLALVGSQVGAWMYVVVLGVWAFEHGGAVWVGVVMVVRSVASAVASPFAGVVADRYPRKVVMVWSDAARVVLLVAGAVTVWTAAPVWVMAFVACGVSVVGAPYPSAMFALLPKLATDPALLSAANAATGTIFAVASLTGPAVGALVLAFSSTAWVFVVAAAAVAVSALLVLTTPNVEPQAAPALVASESGEARRVGVLSGIAAGFLLVREDRHLQLLLIVVGALTFVFGASNVLIVAVAFSVLHSGGSGVGVLFAASGVGALVGAVLAASLAATRPGLALAGGTLATGATFALVGTTTSPAVAVLLLAVMGAASSIGDVADTTLGQRLAPDELLGRFIGIAFAVIFAGTALGSLAAPLLVHEVGVRAATVATGSLLVLIGIFVLRPLARLDQPVPDAVILALLRESVIFAPLPQAILERLAQQIVRESFASGETIIRQGESGERFYLIHHGRVEVAIDGSHAATLTVGDGFGEIALLRDTPRTATIITLEPTELVSLDRASFLATLTRHSGSHLAATQISEARLAA